MLALFLAGIVPAGVRVEPGLDTGEETVFPYLGVWSAVAVGEGYTINGYGLDFTVRVPWTHGGSDDRVAVAGSFTRMYLDPDPGDSGDGVAWRVYVGEDVGFGSIGPLGLYEISDRSEVFRTDWTSP